MVDTSKVVLATSSTAAIAGTVYVGSTIALENTPKFNRKQRKTLRKIQAASAATMAVSSIVTVTVASIDAQLMDNMEIQD